MGDVTRQEEQRETMRFDEACRARSDARRIGDADLVARLRAQRARINGHTRVDSSLEWQAAERIKRLERILRKYAGVMHWADREEASV